MRDPGLLGRLVVILGMVVLTTLAVELFLLLMGALGIVGLGVYQQGLSNLDDLLVLLAMVAFELVLRMVTAIPAVLLILGGRAFSHDPHSPLGIASLPMALIVPGCGASADLLGIGGLSCLIMPWWMLVWTAGILLSILGLFMVFTDSSQEPVSRDLPG